MVLCLWLFVGSAWLFVGTHGYIERRMVIWESVWFVWSTVLHTILSAQWLKLDDWSPILSSALDVNNMEKPQNLKKSKVSITSVKRVLCSHGLQQVALQSRWKMVDCTCAKVVGRVSLKSRLNSFATRHKFCRCKAEMWKRNYMKNIHFTLIIDYSTGK